MSLRTRVTGWRLLCVANLSIAIAGCIGHSLDGHPGLQARVEQYYRLEQMHDWESAYEFRTPNYRRTVPKERYVAHMKQDSEGWKLMSYSIGSVRDNNGKVLLRIEFIEHPPANYLQGRLPKGTRMTEVSMEDNSVWVKIDGTWYCEDAAQRQYLPMNAAISPS